MPSIYFLCLKKEYWISNKEYWMSKGWRAWLKTFGSFGIACSIFDIGHSLFDIRYSFKISTLDVPCSIFDVRFSILQAITEKYWGVLSFYFLCFKKEYWISNKECWMSKGWRAWLKTFGSFGIACSIFDIGNSLFDVRYSLKISTLDVPCSIFGIFFFLPKITTRDSIHPFSKAIH